MDRRDFMKKVIGGSIVAGSTVAFGDYAKLLAAPRFLPRPTISSPSREASRR